MAVGRSDNLNQSRYDAMNLLAQLLSRIVVSPSGCWEWQGCKTKPGYGKKGVKGKTKLVHRLLWELTHQMDIPEGLCVLHKCDNPACCNPDHLFLGTHADNVRDCITKGRKRWKASPGEANGNAKVARSVVDQIRDLYKGPQHGERARTGPTVAEISAATGVSKTQVNRIVKREGWVH